MQNAWLFPVAVVGAVVAMIVMSAPSAERQGRARASDTIEREFIVASGEDLLVDLDAYVDPDFGFMMAIPFGWKPVVVAEDDARLDMLEPGYAIGFESPREHVNDLFSDYLMVEILPGVDTGLFDTDGRTRTEIRIDGRTGWRDQLTLPAATAGTPGIDLHVRQAETHGLGYTVGLFAIGEPTRRALIDDAFDAMLRTFRMPHAPFDIS